MKVYFSLKKIISKVIEGHTSLMSFFKSTFLQIFFVCLLLLLIFVFVCLISNLIQTFYEF